MRLEDAANLGKVGQKVLTKGVVDVLDEAFDGAVAGHNGSCGCRERSKHVSVCAQYSKTNGKLKNVAGKTCPSRENAQHSSKK